MQIQYIGKLTFKMEIANAYKIEDLVEQISELNKIIKLHQDASDDFMVNQYVYRKNEFLKQLIIELLKLDIQSDQIFKTIISYTKVLEKDARNQSISTPNDPPI